MSDLDVCVCLTFGGEMREQNRPYLLGFYDNHTRKPGSRQFSFALKIDGCKLCKMWY